MHFGVTKFTFSTCMSHFSLSLRHIGCLKCFRWRCHLTSFYIICSSIMHKPLFLWIWGPISPSPCVLTSYSVRKITPSFTFHLSKIHFSSLTLIYFTPSIYPYSNLPFSAWQDKSYCASVTRAQRSNKKRVADVTCLNVWPEVWKFC